MKIFHVKISFLDKESMTTSVRKMDNATALTHVLNSLSLLEKDNVTGVKITYIGDVN